MHISKRALAALGVSLAVAALLFSLYGNDSERARSAEVAPLAPREDHSQRSVVLEDAEVPGASLSLVEPTPLDEESKPVAGIIKGVVRDDLGRPVAGTRVLLYREDGSRPVAEQPTRSGEFLFSDLEQGDYRLAVAENSLPAGLVGQWRADKATPGEPTAYEAPIVRIPKGGGLHTVVLRATSASIVVGRIVGPSDEGIEGAHVRLQSSASEGQPSSLHSDAMTRAGGEFEIQSVYSGLYRLQVSLASAADEKYRHMATAVPVDVRIPHPGYHDLGTIAVGRGNNTVRGILYDQDGRPFAGMEVVCFPGGSPSPGMVGHTMASVLAKTTTDENGVYVLEHLPRAVVSIYPSANYDPNRPARGQAAWWVEPTTIDMTGSETSYRVPPMTVEESRPFELRGRIDLQDPGLGAHSLQVSVELLDPMGPRVPNRPWHWDHPRQPLRVDAASGSFSWACETPHPPVRIVVRSTSRTIAPVEMEVHPVPNETEERTIRFPGGARN